MPVAAHSALSEDASAFFMRPDQGSNASCPCVHGNAGGVAFSAEWASTTTQAIRAAFDRYPDAILGAEARAMKRQLESAVLTCLPSTYGAQHRVHPAVANTPQERPRAAPTSADGRTGDLAGDIGKAGRGILRVESSVHDASVPVPRVDDRPLDTARRLDPVREWPAEQVPASVDAVGSGALSGVTLDASALPNVVRTESDSVAPGAESDAMPPAPVTPTTPPAWESEPVDEIGQLARAAFWACTGAAAPPVDTPSTTGFFVPRDPRPCPVVASSVFTTRVRPAGPSFSKSSPHAPPPNFASGSVRRRAMHDTASPIRSAVREDSVTPFASPRRSSPVDTSLTHSPSLAHT